MLQQLLSEIQAGGSLEVSSLAIRFGTSPQLIAAMLAHLQRLGYIQGYGTCSDGCHGCSLVDACGGHNAVHLWQSTNKN